MDMEAEEPVGWVGCTVMVTPRLAKWHIVPTGDLRPHEIKPGCWCRPTEEEDEHLGVYFAHRPLDGRGEYLLDSARLH